MGTINPDELLMLVIGLLLTGAYGWVLYIHNKSTNHGERLAVIEANQSGLPQDMATLSGEIKDLKAATAKMPDRSEWHDMSRSIAELAKSVSKLEGIISAKLGS